MPHAVTKGTGLQALILCGPGSSFSTFTANPDENPKALLPIANRPMVWYPLDFCYRTGITDISLVCPHSAADAIKTALKTNPFLTGLPAPSPDVLAPKGLDQTTGTAEILRLPEVRDRITSDFVVLPCDLVCELGGEKLLQAWMVKSASLSDVFGDEKRSPRRPHSGGLGVWYNTKAGVTPVKGEETDFIATTPLPPLPMSAPKESLLPHLSRLVSSMPTDTLNDLTEEKGGYPIRHGLMRQHPRVRLLSTHRDAHIYIFPQWVIDFVKENEHMDSIGEDVIGWWAKAGWQVGLPEKLGMGKIFSDGGKKGSESPVDLAASPVSSPHKRPEPPKTISSGVTSSSSSKSSPADEDDDESPLHTGAREPIPPILAYVHPSQPSAPLIRRVDTAPLLLFVSLQLAKLPSVEEAGPAASPFAHTRKVAYPEGVRPRTTVTRQDSLVAENVTVEEKSSVKECVVGANCQIHEGAKLLQCLLMEGVVIGKGCRLTRCILGRRSQIGEGSTLVDCEVQENLIVEPKTDEKDNKFMSSEGLEATEEDLLDDGDDLMASAEEAIIG